MPRKISARVVALMQKTIQLQGAAAVSGGWRYQIRRGSAASLCSFERIGEKGWLVFFPLMLWSLLVEDLPQIEGQFRKDCKGKGLVPPKDFRSAITATVNGKTLD